MGLSRAALRFLVREHMRQPFGPSLLTLGRQCVYADVDEVLRICGQEGVATASLADDERRESNIPAWQGTLAERNASDVAFFRLLGVETVQALDCSNFEGAEVICDLNQPVPDTLQMQFDTILDSGTLEHVFDLRTALMNLGRMLTPKGRVIHMGPCNNYANHGFYQFSPTLYLDYYRANGYDVRAFVAEESGDQYQSSRWDLFEVEAVRQPIVMRSKRRMLVIAVAQRNAESTVERIPMQSYYSGLFSDSGAPAAPSDDPAETPGWGTRLKRIVPIPIKHWVRRYVLRDLHQKPWGCTRRGKLS